MRCSSLCAVTTGSSTLPAVRDAPREARHFLRRQRPPRRGGGGSRNSGKSVGGPDSGTAPTVECRVVGGADSVTDVVLLRCVLVRLVGYVCILADFSLSDHANIVTFSDHELVF